VGPCNRNKGRICTEEGESVPIVEGGKRRGKGVYSRTAKEEVYLTIKVTTDGTSILCGEEGQKEKNGARL